MSQNHKITSNSHHTPISIMRPKQSERLNSRTNSALHIQSIYMGIILALSLIFYYCDACSNCVSPFHITPFPSMAFFPSPSILRYGPTITLHHNGRMMNRFPSQGLQPLQFSSKDFYPFPSSNDDTDRNQTRSSHPTTESSLNSTNTNNKTQRSDLASSLMMGAIRGYKEYISPLLLPACRFQPTCSQYGIQAIEEYGPSKGFVLIAWRLARCTPLGGRGYDPPQWPPVPYNYGSY